MIRLICSLLLVVAPLSQAATKAFRLWIDDDNSTVEFLAVGRPSAMKIRGRTGDDKKRALVGELKVQGFSVTGEAKYQLDALDAGIELRTRHMKEKYLETGKYPIANFKLQKLSLPQAFIDGDFDADDEPFSGELTMREITRSIRGTVDLKRRGKELNLRFEFAIKVSDFKIPVPNFMGVTMANEVTVKVTTTPKLEPL